MDSAPNNLEGTQEVILPSEIFASSAFRDTTALLRTAIPFIDEDRASVEANIAFAKSEGDRIGDEIARVQQNLYVLQQRQRAIRTFEERERGLLSPIRKLPLDVLRHIFLLAHTEASFLSHDLTAFPRVAAQVCSYWRYVVQSCAPELWKKVLCATFPLVKECNSSNYGRLLEDCIRFSKEMPLSLCITYNVTPHLLGDSCVQSLARCVHRWRNITITDSDLAKAIFSLIPEDAVFESLETLELQHLTDTWTIISSPKLRHLDVMGDNRVTPLPSVCVVVDSAPSLVHLTLDSVPSPLTAFVGLDWANITHFEATKVEFGPNELITVLARMPNLTHLTFHGPTRATGSIVIPSLEVLKVGECYQVDTNVFDSLIAPRLKKLHVEWNTDWGSLVVFVGRSGCKIEEVTLAGSRFEGVWHVPVFDSVKKLVWEDPLSFEESIDLLKYGSTPSPNDVFRGLENLQISILCGPKSGDSWSINDLIEMLKSRLHPQQPEESTRIYLRSVHIEFISLEDEDVPLLANFVHSELVRTSGVRMEIVNGDSHITTSE